MFVCSVISNKPHAEGREEERREEVRRKKFHLFSPHQEEKFNQN